MALDSSEPKPMTETVSPEVKYLYAVSLAPSMRTYEPGLFSSRYQYAAEKGAALAEAIETVGGENLDLLCFGEAPHYQGCVPPQKIVEMLWGTQQEEGNNAILPVAMATDVWRQRRLNTSTKIRLITVTASRFDDLTGLAGVINATARMVDGREGDTPPFSIAFRAVGKVGEVWEHSFHPLRELLNPEAQGIVSFGQLELTEFVAG